MVVQDKGRQRVSRVVGRYSQGVWDRLVYTALFKIDNQQGPTRQHSERCSVLHGSLDGRFLGRMDACVCMAESLHCSPETITTLLTGYVCVHAQSLQSCPTLCDPMDHSPQCSSVHGILQARILEWVAMSFSRGSSRLLTAESLGSPNCLYPNSKLKVFFFFFFFLKKSGL